MLEAYFMKDVEKYLDHENFTVWKFPARSGAFEIQKRPLIYSYSIMTRAYGNHFNDNSFIEYFNKEGFDVYLVDWGKTSLFSLQGWTLDDLTDHFEKDVLNPLLAEYQADKVNIFAVCIGGAIVSALIEKKKEVADKIHRLAYYGVPIIGTRDLGMEKTFRAFYQVMQPYRELMKSSGLSLFLLDSLILNSVSLGMLGWTWHEYFKESQNCSVQKIIQWTFDDRWVPFPAFMDIVQRGFIDNAYKHDFHIGENTSDIHFLNIVGDDDMLVKPSASIVEWNSTIPKRYLSFRQMILNTDHFMFARPGFEDEKEDIAKWFSGHSFCSIVFKLRDREQKPPEFLSRAWEIVRDSLTDGYNEACDMDKHYLLDHLNAISAQTPASSNIGILSEKMANLLTTSTNPDIYNQVNDYIVPVVEKSAHRHGHAD